VPSSPCVNADLPTHRDGERWHTMRLQSRQRWCARARHHISPPENAAPASLAHPTATATAWHTLRLRLEACYSQFIAPERAAEKKDHPAYRVVSVMIRSRADRYDFFQRRLATPTSPTNPMPISAAKDDGVGTLFRVTLKLS
jgi:hypothetical protein